MKPQTRRAVADEDAGTARIVARTNAALRAGHDVVLPAEVAEAIARGENELRAIRKWRGLTQAQLAGRAKLAQGEISGLETGERAGPVVTWKRLARALAVPMDVIVPD